MKKRNTYQLLIKIMRLSLIQFIMVACLLGNVYATTGNAQPNLNQKINLALKNQQVENLFREIEQQSDFRFVFSRSLIRADRRVSVNVKNQPLYKVLNEVLPPLELKYRSSDNLIIISRADKKDEAMVDGMPEEPGQDLPVTPNVALVRAAYTPVPKEFTITGKVTDEKGESLPGVSILIKGIQQGTTTNQDGMFTLTVEDEKAVLVLSYVGYVSQEVVVSNRTKLEVTLRSDIKALQEVVVVGYGSMNKKNLTSAISSVKAETFAERPIFDVAQAMQGNAAGVNVIQPSGKPGAVMEVRIRGANSINSGTGPLYVIDGIQTYDISGINPDDIVDMNILKDATSTAIYGVNGSAGVVVITTKRAKGESGKGQLSLNAYWGVSNVVKTIDVLNLEQYKDLMKDIRPTYLDVINSPKYAGIETNWRDEIFRQGLDQNYNLSYAKNIKKLKVMSSLGYQNIKGIMSPAQFKRLSGRINADIEIVKGVKFNTSLNYINTVLGNTSDNVSSARGGVLMSIFTTPPMLPVYAEGLKVRDITKDGEKDGQFAGNPFQSSWENPVAFASAQDETRINRFMSSFGLDVSVIKGLVWKPNLTYDYSTSTQDRYTDRYRTAFGRLAVTAGAPTGAGAAMSNPNASTLDTRVSALRSDIKKTNYNFENTLNYILNKGNNDLNVLVGNSVQEFKFERHGYAGNDFPIDLRKFDYSLAKTKAESEQKSVVRYISFFGRVNYTFREKYTVSAVFRTSGASQLAIGNKWGLSPGISGAWIVSEENFLKNSPVISELKLRGGWGRTGNVSGIPPYSSFSISRPDRTLPQPISYSISQFENSELTWETTDDANVALDIAVLNNRVKLSVDAYQRKTKNLLLNMFFPFNASVPYLVNAGDLTNRGVEFTLNTVNTRDKQVVWNSSLNVSLNRNNVDRIKYVNAFALGFFERTTEYAARLTPGQPMGSFFGYKVDKVDPETGKLLFKDINGDGKVDAGDRTFIGNPHPDFTFGFTNNVTYKNFYLDMLISGSVGNKVMNATRLDLESMIDFRNQSTAVLNRWRKPGDITDVPRVNDAESVVVSDRLVENGSFARVKALTIGYNFKNVLSFKKINVYMTGQNLLTLTKYTGFDPEVNAYSGSTNPTFGIDYGTYPQVRTFILGLKATL